MKDWASSTRRVKLQMVLRARIPGIGATDPSILSNMYQDIAMKNKI
jgi:hypothetical protein